MAAPNNVVPAFLYPTSQLYFGTLYASAVASDEQASATTYLFGCPPGQPTGGPDEPLPECAVQEGAMITAAPTAWQSANACTANGGTKEVCVTSSCDIDSTASCVETQIGKKIRLLVIEDEGKWFDMYSSESAGLTELAPEMTAISTTMRTTELGDGGFTFEEVTVLTELMRYGETGRLEVGEAEQTGAAASSIATSEAVGTGSERVATGTGTPSGGNGAGLIMLGMSTGAVVAVCAVLVLL